MKNWLITKKQQQPKSDSSANMPPSGTARSAVLSPHDSIPSSTPGSSSGLATITKEPESDDFESEVEFDLLTPDANQHVTTSGTSFMYSDLTVPLGSVCSASSSNLSLQGSTTGDSSKFDVIIDSGCTCHMMPFHQHFIMYTPSSKSYIILVDKSLVTCLGRGIIHFTLGNKQIILHDVLHVPHL
jgi:hypothetical protein